jgi:hypothetical protein
LPTRARAVLAGGLNTINERNMLMKTILKLTLAAVVAGLLTECALNGLPFSSAANQSDSVGAQTNNEWAGRATDQFMNQLASAAVQ